MIALSLRQTLQEWRAGPLSAVFWALTITLAALTAVNVTSDRAQRALSAKAGELLGADLVISSRAVIDADIEQRALVSGLNSATTVSFPTAVFNDNDDSSLVAVKAVTTGYPLRGLLEISTEAYVTGTPTTDLPAAGEVWADARLLTDLDLQIGDSIAVGSASYILSNILTYEPDRSGGFTGLSPRLLLNIDDAERAGLLRSQSRATWRLLLSGDPENISQFQQSINDLPDINITTPQQTQAQSSNALEQTTRFLNLAAMCAVLLGAAGMLQAGRRYALAQQQPVALLRCFGLSWSEILRLKLWQLLWLLVAACSVGVLLGLTAQLLLSQQLASILSNSLPGIALQPIVETIIMGTMLLASLCLPRLLQLRHQPSLSILNEVDINTDRHWLLTYLPAFIILLVLTAWQLADTRLALIVLTGIIVLVVVLLLAVKALLWLVQQTRKLTSSAPRLAPWRLALSGLQRHQQSNTLHMAALGLALIALLVLGWVRNDMINQWQTSLAPGTPNRFLINIQPNQQEPLKELLTTNSITNLEFGPMAIARITHFNDIDASQWQTDTDQPGRRNGTVNISWRADLPPSNTLTEGEWFDPDNDELQVSLSADWAESLSLELGDNITFQIGSQTQTGVITSFRDVEWDSFNINFFILLNPTAVNHLDYQWIASFHLPDESSSLLRTVTTQFSNITIFDAEALVQRISKLLSRLVRALEIVFLFTLAAALVVLVNAVQSGLSERQRETALLRCLGVKQKTLQQAWWIENFLLGGLTGLLSVLIAATCTWWISREVLDINWQLQPWLVVIGLLVGLLLLPLTTWVISRRSFKIPPLLVLRSL